jgi:serine protease AprX
VVSGAAALVLSQRPSLTPDQVKALLVGSAQRLQGEPEIRQGAGELDLARALTARTPVDAARGVAAVGTGTLEGSRGSFHVSDDGVLLSGERDIFGRAWDSAAMAAAEPQGSTWSGGTWNGSTWSGNTWSGNTWSGSTWSGSTWSGSTWSGSTWSGSTWSADQWLTGAWG